VPQQKKRNKTMKIDFKCYDCIFKLILELAEKLASENEKRKALANEMLNAFTDVSSRGGTPPELLAMIWGELYGRELGVADPRRAKVCVDSVPLAEKSLARLAGIGWIGRNSLVINPKLGSFMVLGEIVTTEECDTCSTAMEEDGCVGCGRCLLRCPTGAILTNRTLNATLCISNKTVEQGPGEWGDTHGWFFGCEECQSCCPHNATSPLHANPRFDALYDPRHYDSNFWAKVSRSEAESLFATTPLVRKLKKW
jgi:epoxyqueuosine reductase